MPTTAAGNSTAQAKQSDGWHPRILIIDDNRAIHQDFRKILDVADQPENFQILDSAIFGGNQPKPVILDRYEIDSAYQGQEGREKVGLAVEAGRRYALAFVDMRMPPGWDGVETIKQIWQADPDIQIVICSAYSDYSWEDLLGEFGRADRLLILKKPFDVAEVCQLASALTEKWRLAGLARLKMEQIKGMVDEQTHELATANQKLHEEIIVRQRSEAALRQSEARFRGIAESNMIGIMFWDATAHMTYANDAFLKMIGYSREDLGAGLLRWDEMTPPEHRALEQSRQEELAQTGICAPYTRECIRKDGSRVPVLLGAALSEGFKDRGVYFAIDRTSELNAQKLEREKLSLKDAIVAMEHLLGVVGHELRTPIAGIRAMSEFLLMEGARHTLDFDVMVKRINAETVRMSETVSNLLEAARLNSGQAHWNWGEFSLHTVCDQGMEPSRPFIDEGSVQLTLSVDPPGATMRGDADAIRRLIMNLVSNARKSTDVGAIEVSARLETRDGQWAVIEVRDTGAGIEPEIAERLGEAFVLNAGVVGSNHVEGSGLGLAISRGIIAAHGGSLSVTSRVGAGTTFIARLRADQSGPTQSITRIELRNAARGEQESVVAIAPAAV